MNIFESDSDATFYAAIITVALTVLYDVINRRWNHRARNLSELLDLDMKLERKNSRVRELVELYEARLVIQEESSELDKQNSYIMSAAPTRGLLFYFLKSLIFLFKVVGVIVSFVSFLFIVDILLKYNVPAPFAYSTAIVLVIISITWAIRSGRRNMTLKCQKYTVQLRTGSSLVPDGKEFNVRIPQGYLSFEHYDFIGLPNYSNVSEIKIYKLVTPNNTVQPIIYQYAYTRKMTLLEMEWATKLNKVGGLLRTSSFYIPFVKAASNGTPFSAYYLKEK